MAKFCKLSKSRNRTWAWIAPTLWAALGGANGLAAPAPEASPASSPAPSSTPILSSTPRGAKTPVNPGPTKHDQVLCPTIVLAQQIDPGLNDVEKRLVCGDAKVDSWKTIPSNQARFHLRTFLQARGYQNPEFFDEAGPQGPRTRVVFGPPTLVKALEADGAPPELHLERRRKVVGEKMTPGLLSTTEGWSVQQLQHEGFACAKVQATADPETQTVHLHVVPGPIMNFGPISEESIPGVRPGTIRRYDAFQVGHRFDGNLITVTENRVSDEKIVESSHFAFDCPESQEDIFKLDAMPVRQLVTAGPPRLLLLGAGVDTEEIFKVRATWRNTRVGNSASWIDFTASGSAKTQTFNTFMNWYFQDHPSRVYIRPELRIEHQNVDPYETIALVARMGPARTWDFGNLAAYATVGPRFDEVRTVHGEGPEVSHFLSLGGELRINDHDFEYNRNSPRTGFSVHASAYGNDGSVLSSAAAQRFNVGGEGLWNFRKYDPPLFVLGVRGGATTVATTEPVGTGQLPPTFLSFLGGSQDLRGFGLLDLPANRVGAETSMFVDVELRLANTLPIGLEPFIFSDQGMLGAKSGALDSTVYYSPGLGIRWASPVGTIRTTLARGFPLREGGGYHFYLDLGEEF